MDLLNSFLRVSAIELLPSNEEQNFVAFWGTPTEEFLRIFEDSVLD